MSIYIAIALGGSIGAMSRYWVTSTTYQWFGTDFSYGTILVNVLGSLAMGFLAVVLVERFDVSDEVRLGIAMDTLHWFDSGAILKALAYVLISVLFCVLGAWAGLITAKQIFLR